MREATSGVVCPWDSLVQKKEVRRLEGLRTFNVEDVNFKITPEVGGSIF